MKAPAFDDIVFEIRNKEYGAYRLRKKYNRNVIIALLIGIIIMATASHYSIPECKSTGEQTETC